MYKIVAADSRASRNGKYLESIGQYNPLVHPMVINVNEARLFAWLKRGAVPSDTMRSLLQRKGLWLKWRLMRKGADETAITSAMEQWQTRQAEKAVSEDARKVRRKEAKRKKMAAEAPAAAQPSPAEPAPASAEPAPAPEPAA